MNFLRSWAAHGERFLGTHTAAMATGDCPVGYGDPIYNLRPRQAEPILQAPIG